MGAPDNRELLAVLDTTVNVRVADAATRAHTFSVEVSEVEAESIERVLASRPFGQNLIHQTWLKSLSTDGMNHACQLRVTAGGKRIEHTLSVSSATHKRLHYLFNAFALDWELVPERPSGVKEHDA